MVFLLLLVTPNVIISCDKMSLGQLEGDPIVANRRKVYHDGEMRVWFGAQAPPKFALVERNELIMMDQKVSVTMTHFRFKKYWVVWAAVERSRARLRRSLAAVRQVSI
ncbi:hypothetical protein STEG23_034734 [Scotinomys teguina]